MICNECDKATKAPRTYGGYLVGCPGCESRMMAHSPDAKDALLGHPQGLQAAMRQIAKTPEAYRQMRIGVYEWIRRLDEAKL